MQDEPVMGPGTPSMDMPSREGGQAGDPGWEEPPVPPPGMPEMPAPTVPGDGGAMPGAVDRPGVVLVPHPDIVAGSVEIHPIADILPPMPEPRYERLEESVAVDGQQVRGTLFQGKLLDGRHRDRACDAAGIQLRVNELIGTEADALTYVLSANQYRRELTKSQRAAVAATLVPMISEQVAQERLEKVRRTWEAKREGGWREKVPSNLQADDVPTRARAVAADLMGVNDRYVADAMRLQREDPALFEKVRMGRVTLPAAMRQLAGSVTGAQARHVTTVRTRLNKFFRRVDEFPTLLDRLTQVMDELEGE